jgi:putative DNA primase/helicase
VNWENYDEVRGQLRAAGLIVDELVVGQRQRVRVQDDREKRGWYHLHELPLTERPGSLLVGSYGVWRGNDNGAQKVKLDRRDTLSAEQQAALRARMAADRKAADASRKREVERAAARAQAMWAKLSPDGESEYLQRKGVAPHGVRFAESGAMVLPVLDAHGQVHGLQAIYPRDHPKVKRFGRDKDFWPAGLAKQGHFFLIGSPASAGVCLLAEGYATAASAFEAVGLPVAVAFDAGNLVHVASALRARWPRLPLLVLADDDYLGKCRACGQLTLTEERACAHCGEPHLAKNAGVAGAQATALLGDGITWVVPRWAAERPTDKKGPTDFNDLHLAEGLHVVRTQIERALPPGLGKGQRASAAPASAALGEGGGGRPELRSVVRVDELLSRFSLVYEAAETVFDAQEHKLVPLASMRNLCVSRQMHRAWIESPDKHVVRVEEVGFDPGEADPAILCNLWGGWPTRAQRGRCDKLLELGEYLCSQAGPEMWPWVLRWMAYPVQHPGAKMKSAVIMHGPQGTGKNLFWEAHLGVFGTYGKTIGQEELEDKHNDWASRTLFALADEVLARQEMFHHKNKLKSLITGDWISINPKFVTRYRERNHINIVFLSNEYQPMALERDDRRHAVIWTPPKWDAAMYRAVVAELREGGVAAWHQHLLEVDLADFDPATPPPMTDAKLDLIELGADSSDRFWVEWTGKHLLLPVCSVRTEDLYRAYSHWCRLQGVSKPAQLNTCIGSWVKRPGVRKVRERHYLNHSMTREVQSQVLHPPGIEAPNTKVDLSKAINAFNQALKEWADLTSPHAAGGAGKGAAGGAAPVRKPATVGGDDDEPF